MAPPRRRTTPSLSEHLFSEPYRFEFFQATRLLHGLAPGRAPIGQDGEPIRETVRFKTEQSLSFPASEILDLEHGEDDRPPTMTVRFMGLTGPKGVMPRHYTERIIERAYKKDTKIAEFLDLFNHRLVALFFRAWEKYRLHLQYDAEGSKQFATFLFSFFGLGTRGLRNRLAVQDASLLFYTGLLAQRPRSATALENLVSDYFGSIGARAIQFVGQWLDLDPSSLTNLGRIGRNNQLGVDTVIGSRVWHTQSRFRLRLGPMGWRRFGDFLPTGKASLALLELTRFYVGPEYDFEFQLVLKAPEVPLCELGSKGPDAPRLGWSTWIRSKPFDRDPDDTVLDGQALQLFHQRAQEAFAS